MAIQETVTSLGNRIAGKRPTVIDGPRLCGMVISAAKKLDSHQGEINNMNVFPVPDGDTGINMTLTMASVRTLDGYDGTVGDCAEKIANTVLRSARGNSGAILSLFFRGIAKSLAGKEVATAEDLANALKRGTDEAYRAVMSPTEGTILTVMRVCSEKAVERVARGRYRDDPAGLFGYVLKTGERTLAKTPDLLPVLKEANVVDAGGYGFLFLISGMLDALTLRPVSIGDGGVKKAETAAHFSDFSGQTILFTYCTECVVAKDGQHAQAGEAADFRDFLSGIGDSVVFMDDGGIIKLHIHTNHPGQVIEKALEYGELESMKIENMCRQHSEMLKKEKDNSAATIEKEIGFVAVCMGEGIREVFLDLGVDRVVFGGQTMNPSSQDILDGINATPAKCVYVLPNNKNVYPTACQAAEMTEHKRVIVLNTKSVPQGVCAMMAYDPDADRDGNTAAMNTAIGRVRTAQMTKAIKDTSVEGIKIDKGQTVAMIDGRIICSADREEECLEAIGAAFSDASFVTVYMGEGVDRERGRRAMTILRSRIGGRAEITEIMGGQPIYDYIIAAE